MMEPISHEVRARLEQELVAGATAYVRNAAAAEVAILQGQFNMAKILRTLGQIQRTLALNAVRTLGQSGDAAALLQQIQAELQRGLVGDEPMGQLAPELQYVAATKRMATELITRSLQSLAHNSDVLEKDVAFFVFACHRCGAVQETEDAVECPVCGAIRVEQEWFGPFHMITAERLGKLAPREMQSILAAIPDQLTALITNTPTEGLRRKPTAAEWSPVEIMTHMMECDRVFQRAAQRILAEDDFPAVRPPAPPWKLHEGKGYEQMAPTELLALFQQTRRATLVLIAPLTPEQWARQGRWFDQITSIIDLGVWLTNHDLGHLAQIRRLCQAAHS